MTLILTLLSPTWVFQVSDRLVTRTSDQERFDVSANKTVIYHARNALVTIGCSGPAYLDHVPTDRWIAEKLWGEPLGAPNDLELPLRMSISPQLFDIGQAVQLLVTELTKTYTTQRLKVPISLVIAGWQWKIRNEDDCRPICYEIFSTPPSPCNLTWHSLPRYWHTPSAECREDRMQACLRWTPPGWGIMQKTEVAALMERLASTQEAKAMLGELVKAVQNKAATTRVVGADCLIVILQHPRRRIVEATYEGEAYHYGSVGTESGSTITFPVGYAPWVIGPREAIPAQLVAGVFTHQLGRFAYRAHGPRHQRIVSFGGSLARPTDPSPLAPTLPRA